MKFKIKAYPIYELGARANQEDYLYPYPAEHSDDTRLFIVCDGMGGHEHGEVASKNVCQAMSQYILSQDSFSEETFQMALSAAYDTLDNLDQKNDTVKKMGTTMTLLHLHNGGAFLAHIGDSRIFHIRPSENAVLFETRDHSLVNQLVAIGELTEEEAAISPQRNIITRAMQPHQPRRARADIHQIEDIKAGDYFLLCTDGMLENSENEYYANILSDSSYTDERKVEILRDLTKDNRDNHTAYLVHIIEVN